MNKPKEIDYKNLYEQQVKALKILNERLRNKEKELKRLYREMAHLRQEIRDNNKQELKQRIDKAIEYINKSWTGGYTDATLKYKVEEINITELLEILKDSDVDA